MTHRDITVEKYSSLYTEPSRFQKLWRLSQDFSSFLKSLGLTLVFMSAMLASYWVFSEYPEGSFVREVNSGVIGALITIPLTAFFGLVAFRKQWNILFESKRLKNVARRTWKDSKIAVGTLEIPGISIIECASHEKAWDLHTDLKWKLLPANPRNANSALVKDADEILGKVLSAVKERNCVLPTNDSCLDLVEFDSWKNGATGRLEISMVVAEAHYYDFISTSNELDRKLEDETTLREKYGIHISDISEVRSLPVIAKLGCGTVVITSDNQIILGVRERTYVAGKFKDVVAGDEHPKKQVHFVAEGMIPSDTYNDIALRMEMRNTEPAKASLRAQNEELGISTENTANAQIKQLVPTGFFFDHCRMQPCFSFLSFVDRTFSEIKTGWSSAPDKFENERIFEMSFSIENLELIKLLLGKHTGYELASNHAAAMLWFACIYQFGFEAVRSAILSYRDCK